MEVVNLNWARLCSTRRLNRVDKLLVFSDWWQCRRSSSSLRGSRGRHVVHLMNGARSDGLGMGDRVIAVELLEEDSIDEQADADENEAERNQAE